ncbi:cytochrome c oxidase subunit 6A1, mitochondrial-like isoform X2 [Liolophura sinensis]|uniref:cytochrome c oxidase subunit 6A1, mitochondrial-like isoform X2 n=1 Tax=Liolophura sinensis TaxID=3198878 RepID=UPI0031587756
MASRLGNLRLMRSFASAHGGHGGQHAGSARLWQILTLTVALPGVGICWLSAYVISPEHHVQPEFKPCSWLRLRNKAFPWGDGNHTLFHNPHLNPLPDGYEE